MILYNLVVESKVHITLITRVNFLYNVILYYGWTKIT